MHFFRRYGTINKYMKFWDMRLCAYLPPPGAQMGQGTAFEREEYTVCQRIKIVHAAAAALDYGGLGNYGRNAEKKNSQRYSALR